MKTYHKQDGKYLLDEFGNKIPSHICICFAHSISDCVCGAWDIDLEEISENNMNTITTIFGTFNEEQIKMIEDAIREIDVVLTLQDDNRQKIKDILAMVKSELGVPPKTLRELATTYHKTNFDEKVSQFLIFRNLYESIIEK